ncbi:MAG: chemotaxis protein CheA [Gemmatimonadetes bacterium]|uniref:Chemotaxis protein CheA n=1 Tax=Candidatus Kutchimonas denitrificans TaxID=3056748 RepID=A0AAE5CBF4_9BACT|nr:chemotaxis protein CheA [Gemmatimonadota bacterium]NIR74523.1 chemotaxis protein CheA [Candidatus Kutchimonas denitrificans]NIS02713.1 chemotaxis protein CheA [Gemmatimonadota bacterium]NIT68874.1 chemotaxis protein CheA [Gemmatimonadota bacterium]NIU52179.1 hypothetical protein [Gemmatimonadota bacterium]
MSQQEKYAELFAAEAREHLAEMSRALVVLESEPGDRDSLDAIFRSVHTIKGMAAAMGYEVAARLAHAIESVLDELRQDRRQVDSEVIDLLLDGTDQLEEVVVATVEGEKLPDPAVTIERLVLWRLAADQADDAEDSDADSEPAETTATSRSKAGAIGPVPAGRGRPGLGGRADSRVRVDIRRLDALMNLIGELAIVRGRLRALAAETGLNPLQEAVERAGGLISEMQSEVIESRMVPVWQVFDRFPRLVRDAARKLDKEVEFEMSGKNLELDRALLDAISDPLVHLLRNAVDHGLETAAQRAKAGKPAAGRIELAARREKSRVIIEVSDDGRGIDRDAVLKQARAQGLIDGDGTTSDQELFRIMARPGFSTVENVTELSGRGVGLNVVEDAIRGLGGSVELQTEKGVGTTFRMEMPVTLAILRALLVEIGGQVYAIPATFTRESIELDGTAVARAHGREWIRWREDRVPLLRLGRLFDAERGSEVDSDDLLHVVALEFGSSFLAVSVDRFLGEEEIVVKPFAMPLGAVPVFSGATVRPNGLAALVIDVGSLARWPEEPDARIPLAS